MPANRTLAVGVDFPGEVNEVDMRRRSIGLILGFLLAQSAQGKALEFHVTFTREVSEKPFTGRVYVLLSREARTTLPGSLSWMNPDPLFARDVKDWKPGEKLVIGADALGHPIKL